MRTIAQGDGYSVVLIDDFNALFLLQRGGYLYDPLPQIAMIIAHKQFNADTQTSFWMIGEYRPSVHYRYMVDATILDGTLYQPHEVINMFSNVLSSIQ